MITCSRCQKENQDHYKFCLGCGAKIDPPAVAPPAEQALETAKTALPPPPDVPVSNPFAGGAARLPTLAPAPKPSTLKPQVSPPGLSPPVETPASEAAAALAEFAPISTSSQGASEPCPQCGKMVISTHAFCGGCGYRIKPAGGAAVTPSVKPVQKTMFMAPTPAKTTPRGHLTLIRPDGTEGGVHPLQEGENLAGRGQGSLFDADPYLSPRHGEFVLGADGLLVKDLRSLNGVFVKIAAEERLESGDIFRIGQELLRFDVIATAAPLEDGTEIIGTPNPGYWGRISVIVGRDVDGPAFPLFDESVVLGRERGDILFPEDGYVSGTHAQITLRDGQAYLSDLGSSNGTFFRIHGSRALPSGSLLLMGQQLFRASFR